MSADTAPARLVVSGLAAHYGQFQALAGVELRVGAGETLAVVGANGAGKSTLLAALVGLVDTPACSRIEFNGEALRGVRPYQRARRGIGLVPEGRRLFPSLTVHENLLIGAVPGRRGHWDVDGVLDVFPHLAALRDRPAGTLSGGEQQAVAIGRGLMGNPEVLLLDEVSLGLAPTVVGRLYEVLAGIAAGGLTMVIVEQDVGRALGLAGRVLCLRAGRTVLSAPASAVTADAVAAAYFGTPA